MASYMASYIASYIIKLPGIAEIVNK